MSRIALTGAGGFLGLHVRGALQELGAQVASIAVGEGYETEAASAALSGADRLVHIAGVNRADDAEITAGNVGFAQQLAAALREADAPPPVVVYANSTQSTNGSVYGESKARAAEILADAAATVGATFVDVHLPNLFGEHGRPFYNAVTATFCHLVSQGEAPVVENDKALTLLHAQNAADVLLGRVATDDMSTLTQEETVAGILHRVQGYDAIYRNGEIPNVDNVFDRDLFNTFRSYTFPAQAPISLARHADNRGSFFEIIRSHGGPGQSSFSTTVPGVTRGDHFHRRKIERFTVLQGRARISLRKLGSDEVVSFDVSGDAPGAVDMPTLWAHNITNVGSDVLYTSFWTNDIFDPENPDTIAEAV